MAKDIAELVKENSPPEPSISFDKSDIERRMGFPAGKFTDPGPLLAPLMATLAAVGFYGILAFIPESYVKDMFTKRSAVPYFIVFLSAWACASLLVKLSKLRLQKQALALKLLPPEDPGFALTRTSAERVLAKLYQEVDDPRKFLLTRRIHNALSNLRNMGRIGDVKDVLQAEAENDEGQMESSYTTVRGLIWAIPVLGFIGTVWGLSLALGDFGGVLSAAQEMNELRNALQGVTGGLSTAFETTLQGLVAALCIHILMIAVKRREEQFLDDCSEYCQRVVIGRLRLIDET